MVSLKWGDVLSTVLPGSVALFAVAPLFPPLWSMIVNLNDAGLATGIALLFGAALAGGVLEGITRVTWERRIKQKCKSPDMLSLLTKDNLELYERGVQSSYKYVTFYANLAWAVLLLAASYVMHSPQPRVVIFVGLVVTPAILLYASWIQWTYYVNYQTKVFLKRSLNADERSACGDKSEIRTGPDEGTENSEGVRGSRDSQPETGIQNGQP